MVASVSAHVAVDPISCVVTRAPRRLTNVTGFPVSLSQVSRRRFRANEGGRAPTAPRRAYLGGDNAGAQSSGSLDAGSSTHTAFFSPRCSTPHEVAAVSTMRSPRPVRSEAISVAIFWAPAPSSTSIRIVPGWTATATRNGVSAWRTALVASSEVTMRATADSIPSGSSMSPTNSRAARTEAGSLGNSFEAPMSLVMTSYLFSDTRQNAYFDQPWL